MKQQHYFLFLFQFLCWLISELPTGFSWQSLVYLDLGSNLLEGPLPSSICNSKNLEGTLRRSLKDCKYLEVLDVGNNKIRDTFPMWLQSLPQLHVLILRLNGFYGNIGTSKSRFEKLRIVDLAYNNFTGSVPAEFFENLPAMMAANNGKNVLKYMGKGDGSYYLDSVTVVMKGLDMEIKSVLSIHTTIDLSGNLLEGPLPSSICNLKNLELLVLAKNLELLVLVT